MDRRYNRYWRLSGVPLGGAAAISQLAAAGAPEETSGHPRHQPVDRLLFESHDSGDVSLVCGPGALAALMEALERRGARESLLYASLLRFKDGLEAGMSVGKQGEWSGWCCVCQILNLFAAMSLLSHRHSSDCFYLRCSCVLQRH